MPDDPAIEGLAKGLTEFQMVVSPWDNRCLIPKGWVDWDQGNYAKAARGEFRVWRFDRAEDATAVADFLASPDSSEDLRVTLAALDRERSDFVAVLTRIKEGHHYMGPLDDDPRWEGGKLRANRHLESCQGCIAADALKAFASRQALSDIGEA